MNLEEKDALYYYDLMYELKRLARFEQKENTETEERIALRLEDIVEEQEGPIHIAYRLSIFQEELFEIIRGISLKAGEPFKGLSQISKYPELVQETLKELEQKKNAVIEEVCATSNNHQAFIVSQEKSEEFLAQKPNQEVAKQMKKVLSQVNIRTDKK